jgi:hypothetical protein
MKRLYEDCRCDTGQYCHRHMRYRHPSTPVAGSESRVYSSSEEGADRDVSGAQRCGGGRRIMRKKMGGT